MSLCRAAAVAWTLAGAILVSRAYLLQRERVTSRNVHPHPFDP